MPARKPRAKSTTCKRTLVYPVCRSKPTGRFRKKTRGVRCVSDLRTLCRSKTAGTFAPRPARGAQRAAGRVPHYPPGTRVRIPGRGGHPAWTGTVVPSVPGHVTVRAANGREVTFFPATLHQFAEVVGRVDTGTAHHRPVHLAQGRTRRPGAIVAVDVVEVRETRGIVAAQRTRGRRRAHRAGGTRLVHYRISHTGGGYLRATMRTADSTNVEQVLRAAARYKGILNPSIEHIDGGDIYITYPNDPEPILVARPVTDR